MSQMIDFSWSTISVVVVVCEVVSRAASYIVAALLALDTTLDHVPTAKRDSYEKKLTLLGPRSRVGE